MLNNPASTTTRRSHGLSVGVNLNLDQTCNFNCLYCQVPRSPALKIPPSALSVATIENELRSTLQDVISGHIYHFLCDLTSLWFYL